MRHWEKQPSRPTVGAMVDRRQLLLGCAVLLGLAVLLMVGLTPRRASAPEPDAAQAGGESALTLAEDCTLLQCITYTPCGHSVTRRQTLPPELVGKARSDLEAAYNAWQVTSYAADEVVMEQSLSIHCPQHMILMPDDSGMLCIFQNKYGDALAMVEALDIPISDLADAYQEELRPGKGFDSQNQLAQWLESIES